MNGFEILSSAHIVKLTWCETIGKFVPQVQTETSVKFPNFTSLKLGYLTNFKVLFPVVSMRLLLHGQYQTELKKNVERSTFSFTKEQLLRLLCSG